MKVPKHWKPVIIESPFKGNDQHTEGEHRAYLNRCIADCISKGETPYASHKMLTDSLDDGDEAERALGMSAGLDMSRILLIAGAVPVFYVDYGSSSGMKSAEKEYDIVGVLKVTRTIGKNPS